MPLFHATGAAAQIGFDLQPRATTEAGAVDLKVLHDPLHVVACLGERNQLDPVDRVDLGIARIAVSAYAQTHSSDARVPVVRASWTPTSDVTYLTRYPT